ncbi:MAG: DUF420 domain-containing protein [candidate division Zixibacteria bacterium]|nr:DUF420 domain-containing protein [candidate division Zixibacteria bacterium]
MSVEQLPTVNAMLNFIATIFLVLGFIRIRRGDIATHKKFMVSALISSVLFLTCYLYYHYHVGSVPYPHYDWTRPLYFLILIPHIILAAIMTPFIIAIVWFALRGSFVKHKRLARWVWPVWMYVSVTGVIVYLMLYRL